MGANKSRDVKTVEHTKEVFPDPFNDVFRILKFDGDTAELTISGTDDLKGVREEAAVPLHGEIDVTITGTGTAPKLLNFLQGCGAVYIYGIMGEHYTDMSCDVLIHRYDGFTFMLAGHRYNYKVVSNVTVAQKTRAISSCGYMTNNPMYPSSLTHMVSNLNYYKKLDLKVAEHRHTRLLLAEMFRFTDYLIESKYLQLDEKDVVNEFDYKNKVELSSTHDLQDALRNATECISVNSYETHKLFFTSETYNLNLAEKEYLEKLLQLAINKIAGVHGKIK